MNDASVTAVAVRFEAMNALVELPKSLAMLKAPLAMRAIHT